jgi:hypothetical protein
MGVLLTVDGRECPGCDSPGRFCVGARTEIVTPAGIDTQALINRIATTLDSAGSQAVGWSQSGTFYLDVGLLPRLDERAVTDLLSTTGSALNALGYQADIGTALDITRRILSE